jgi:hypothetical protein
MFNFKGKVQSYTVLVGIVLVLGVLIVALLIANKDKIKEGFFDSYKKYSVEYYYMDGCGHCIDFNESGIWDRLNNLEWANVSLKKYNRSENLERVSKMKISGFPTILIVDNSAANPKILASFEDARTYEKLVHFIKEYDEKE